MARKTQSTQQTQTLESPANENTPASPESPTFDIAQYHPTESMIFNIPLAKLVGKRDIQRIITDDPNSPYVAVSVVVDRKAGMFAVEHENSNIEYVQMTSETDSVFVKIQRLSYGANVTQQASLLSGIKLFHELVETTYIPAKRDAEGNVTLANVGYTSLGASAEAVTLEPTFRESAIQAIQGFIKRCERGAKNIDKRVETWNTPSGAVTTNYGYFVAQRRANRA